jgi:hypothetical protein
MIKFFKGTIKDLKHDTFTKFNGTTEIQTSYIQNGTQHNFKIKPNLFHRLLGYKAGEVSFPGRFGTTLLKVKEIKEQ